MRPRAPGGMRIGRRGEGRRGLHRVGRSNDGSERGFSRQNLQQMGRFYLAWPTTKICQTLSDKSAMPQI